MHVHTSALDALLDGAMFLIWAFLFRMISTKYRETSFGKALAFIH